MDQTYLPGGSRKRIQDLIKHNKTTQAELAEKIDLSESALSRYLQGKTEMLGDGYIIRIAKLFNVSTDFILGETDIPDRKNYDIEELGLSAEAVKLLYTGELDTRTLNQLLENPRFPTLLQMLACYQDETMIDGIKGMNEVMTFVRSMLIGHAKYNPKDSYAAAAAARHVQFVKTPPVTADTNSIQNLFMQIVQDMKQNVEIAIEQKPVAPSEVIKKLRKNMLKGKNKYNMRKMTPEEIVDAIIRTAATDQFPVESFSDMRSGMLRFLSRPGDLSYDK